METLSTVVRVEAPKLEHRSDALGIGNARPRLSFIVSEAPRGWHQVAYEVETIDAMSGARESWRIESKDNVLVPWPAPPLASRQARRLRLRVWGEGDRQPSEWSPASEVEAGLLDAKDWKAKFITPDWDLPPETEQPSPLLRREFEVRGEMVRARLYVTALGLYEAELNGRRVGDHALAPGWTSYQHRLRYQTFDVTALLTSGRNAIGVWLAEGWYAGRLGATGTRRNYGDRIAALVQIEIGYADGHQETIVSDESWRASKGPITRSGIYNGESYDARREQREWSRAGFDDATWSRVVTVDRDLSTLVAPLGPPVRCIEELAIAAVVAADPKRIIVDFGQNLVGRCRISVNGEAGTTISLRHAEVLQDGELYVRPLRSARATDEYTLHGGDLEVWEPRFTFHGFRYLEISGWPGPFDPGSVTARVYHTDMSRTGWFECSDARINKLHENVVWSMRGNFLDLPTDCPQRDERFGWTGDIQVFAPTAAFLFECIGLLESWLRDVAAEQLPDGTVPMFVPWIQSPDWSPVATAIWSDVAVLTPWVLYQRYGDLKLVERQYPSAKAHVDLVDRHAGPKHLWDTGFQFGDWLDPTAPPDDPGASKADRYLVASAYFAHSSRVLASMADVLGLEEDAARYSALSDQIASAFRERYILPSGLLADDAQTSYALALDFGLIPAGTQKEAAAQRLIELVERSGFRLGTGFAGTPVICRALAENGGLETAYRLLLNEECPSWLYMVKQGATTIWERWDGLLPDGTVNPGEMTSFNHYALGSVADWLHTTVAGLAPTAPGYRRLLIRPRPGGGLTEAAAALMTPYGRAEVKWSTTNGLFSAEVVVPIGTTALIEMPGQEAIERGAGHHHFSVGLIAG